MPEIKLDERTTIGYESVDLVEVSRCDFSSKITIGSIKRTDEGYLKGSAPIAKIGVMKYLMADGSIVNEFVPRETLFNVDSMNTMKLQPVTNAHPTETLLNSTNVSKRKVGMTGESVSQDGDFLVTSMVITDKEAIDCVDQGRSQLSPGYTCSLLFKPGTYNGEKYDAIQLNRKYNHLALCDKARGGEELKLNFDNFDGIEPTKKGVNMPKYRIDGIEYEGAQELINLIDKLTSKVDSLESEKTTLTTNIEKLQAKNDEQVEKIDSLEKRDITKEINEGVSKRMSILKVAETVLDSETFKKIDSLTDIEIKKAIIVSKSPKTNLTEKSEVYIDARFDSIVELIDFDPDAIARQREASAQKNDGSNVDIVEKAKNDAEDRIKNAYLKLGE